jgi:Intrinsic membrane protein PufX
MDDFSFEPSRKVKMYLWAGMEMGRGFTWALAITTVIILGLMALRLVGLHILPDASQEAPPPMGAIVQPLTVANV